MTTETWKLPVPASGLMTVDFSRDEGWRRMGESEDGESMRALNADEYGPGACGGGCGLKLTRGEIYLPRRLALFELRLRREDAENPGTYNCPSET